MAARAGSRKKPPPPSNDESPPPPDHNGGAGPLSQDDKDDLFLIHLAQARQDNEKLEELNSAVRGFKKQRTRNRTACRTDGFPLAELDDILTDELLPYFEVQEREDKRARMRGLANQPGGNLEQMDLFSDSFAKKERDAAYWVGHGTTTGMRGLERDPAKYEVPPEHHQVWMEGWYEGQKRLARAWFTKARIDNVPIPGDIPRWDPEANAIRSGTPAPESEPTPAEPDAPMGDEGDDAVETVEEPEPEVA